MVGFTCKTPPRMTLCQGCMTTTKKKTQGPPRRHKARPGPLWNTVGRLLNVQRPWRSTCHLYLQPGGALLSVAGTRAPWAEDSTTRKHYLPQQCYYMPSSMYPTKAGQGSDFV